MSSRVSPVVLWVGLAASVLATCTLQAGTADSIFPGGTSGCSDQCGIAGCSGQCETSGCGDNSTWLFWGGQTCNVPNVTGCGGRPATFYFDIEYMALFRDTDVQQPSIPPTPDFQNKFGSGVLMTGGVALTSRYRVEASYFGDASWSDSTVLGNAPISIEAQLENWEVAVKHLAWIPCNDFAASFQIGARMMNIDESIAFNLQRTAAENQLTGIQIGTQLQFLTTGRSWVDWDIKGMIANNDVSVTGIGQDSVTAYAGETSVVFNYQMLPSATLRMGYRGIWLAGLALAEEHFGRPLEVNDRGETVYHGFNVGIVWNH